RCLVVDAPQIINLALIQIFDRGQNLSKLITSRPVLDTSNSPYVRSKHAVVLYQDFDQFHSTIFPCRGQRLEFSHKSVWVSSHPNRDQRNSPSESKAHFLVSPFAVVEFVRQKSGEAVHSR